LHGGRQVVAIQGVNGARRSGTLAATSGLAFDIDAGAMTAALKSRIGAEEEIRDTSAQDVLIDPALNHRKRRRWMAIVSAGAVLLAIASIFVVHSWVSTAVVVPRERIRIAVVQRGKFVRDVSAEGSIVAAVSPTLFSSAAGTVTFLVKAGEAVKKGQALATIDSPQFMNEFQQEQATLDGLDSGLERQSIEARRQILQSRQAADLAGVQIHAAERELRRAESAWQSHIIPERDYEKAGDELETARLIHKQALANARLQEESLNFELNTRRLERDRQRLLVEDLKRRVDELNVRSPVNGLIAAWAVAQSSTVVAHAPLLTVVDLSEFEVEFQVPESYSGSLGIDMPAEVTYGGQLYPATVTAISPEVQQNEVVGRVRFSKRTPVGLRQNQRVNLRIIMDSRDNVLKVERGGFTDAGDVAYVVAGESAARRPIRLGAMSVAEVEILEGLVPGEKIIVSNVADFSDAPVVRLSN
jgi:HlyD family secretion protein